MEIKKTVKIQQTGRNTRVEIPTIFVDNLNIEKGDYFEWHLTRDGVLFGTIIQKDSEK